MRESALAHGRGVSVAMIQLGFNENLVVLQRAECLRLLEGHGVGRVGCRVHGRPVIFPINYVVLDNAVLFRARRGSDLDRGTGDVDVAFEVDGADNVYHEGWSVLVTGLSVHVRDAGEVEQLRAVSLLPWAGEDRDLFVRIALDQISGRRVHHCTN